MEIRWLSAYVDLPADVFGVGTRFWQAVTGSDRSDPSGKYGEYSALIPPTGDPYLEVQVVGDDRPRIHLDLHVDSKPEAADRAVGLGARVVADRGWLVMESPGGFLFCFVSYDGESKRAMPFSDLPHRLDQVSIDVPAVVFESESRFWSDLTGWEIQPSALDEFARLSTPASLPYRILMQRLGEDDAGNSVRAHLDIACGDNIDRIAARHEGLGAVNLGRRRYWVTMQDPAGLPYCLTPRDPFTGAVPQAG